MTRVQISDQVSPLLEDLFRVGEGFGLQALNKAGAKVRNTIASQSRRLGTHKFDRDTVTNRITNNGQKKVFSRKSKSSGANESDFGSLARYRLYPHSRIVIAGFFDSKSYTSQYYSGGRVVAGRGQSVKGTQSKTIAEQIHDGGRVTLTPRQKAYMRYNGWGNVAKRGYITKEAHRFFTPSLYVSQSNAIAQREFPLAVQQFERERR